jgi:hypothetical protein
MCSCSFTKAPPRLLVFVFSIEHICDGESTNHPKIWRADSTPVCELEHGRSIKYNKKGIIEPVDISVTVSQRITPKSEGRTVHQFASWSMVDLPNIIRRGYEPNENRDSISFQKCITHVWMFSGILNLSWDAAGQSKLPSSYPGVICVKYCFITLDCWNIGELLCVFSYGVISYHVSTWWTNGLSAWNAWNLCLKQTCLRSGTPKSKLNQIRLDASCVLYTIEICGAAKLGTSEDPQSLWNAGD